MSSSDQQYPYPYDPQQPQQPQAPQYWPDGTAGQPAPLQEPGGHDQGATQTWQAPTWDTQYQPTIQRDQHAGQAQAYGQPQQPGAYGAGQQQPDAYGAGQQDPFGTGPQQSGAYATGAHQPDPYGTPQPQYQEPRPQQHQPYPQFPSGQHQQQPFRPAADTAYLPPQGASGSLPLPPEAQAAPGPVTPAAPQPSQPGPDASGYSAPTTLGNARLTDAQRARAEGRSPIIAPGMQPAAITAGLG
ncbi:hypothetical protein JHN49_32810, partial [Streptomyces sp. MBT57]|nr:hypothetical protein [Streptomyces sp. MBT57]